MLSLTEKQILDTPLNKPENIFTNDKVIADREFRELAKIWHPDINKVSPNAETVFAHISGLYESAKSLIGTAGWKRNSILTFNNSKETRHIRYTICHDFELGKMYIGPTELVYAVEKEYEDLFNNAKRFVNKFKYGSDRMKDEISRYLPNNVEYLKSKDMRYMIIPKTPDVILLDDVYKHFGNKIDPKHVAWIQSTLHNLACYLEFAGIVHCDISLPTYFISPQHHSGMLLGGWWYSAFKGEPLKTLPVRSSLLCPPDLIRDKIAHKRLDLELIRATGRELLGDIYGSKLKKDPAIPKPLVQWMNGTTTGKARVDYELWGDILQLSFGARRFTELKLDADTVYSVHK